MSTPLVSVIVVSRGRADVLPLCLTGLGQLYYPGYEIIVVTDPGGIKAVQKMGWENRVKLVAFNEPNISAARNAGIIQAAGDVVAFIDDDAVPEPTWLTHLIEPFQDNQISAAGGFVRGRNGISYQWMANFLDHTGKNIPLNILDTNSLVPTPLHGGAVKTEGTNCAFRRNILTRLGGFDPVYRFYNDESDLNMRLAQAKMKTALVPLAQVHHGYGASERRTADRAPTSLFEIGASTMVFLRKYCVKGTISAALETFTAEQRVRLINHMVKGAIEPCNIEHLLADLQAGYNEGKIRPLTPLAPLVPMKVPFLRFKRKGATQKAICLSGRWGSGARLAHKAKQQVEAGNVVSVYIFSPTALFHHIRFHKDGYWLQTGGVFGRSERQEPLIQPTSLEQRAERENVRVASMRKNA